MNQSKSILKKYWNFDSFKNSQEEIIASILEKHDTIALLPTGGGKSLCYQIPTLINNGVCLVISPLISLMHDQIKNLDTKGIKAITFASNSSSDDIVTTFDTIKYGNVKFIYISPERLQSSIIIQKLKEVTINLIAVDEAHCISEWGHDFRPSYRKIRAIRSLFPEVNIVALTATATKKVIEDIRENLEMKNAHIFKDSFHRSNLAYQIFTKENKLQIVERILKKNPSPSIIYVNSRKKTEQLSNHLNDIGFKTLPYHGGMLSKDKTSSFDQWMNEESMIIIATNAFGMGIDKPNVRKVIHLDLPNSIENYVQESGRAGRDGDKSFSVLLQNENDIRQLKKNTIEKLPSIDEIKYAYKRLYQYFQIANGEKTEEVYRFNFQEFCDRYQLRAKKTTTILRILEKNEIIYLNKRFNQQSTVQFIVTSKQLQHFSTNNQSSLKLVELLLRNYSGIFQNETSINEFDLAKKASLTSSKIKKLLQELNQKEVLMYKEANLHQELIFLFPREDDKTINSHSKEIQKYLNHQIRKTNNLITFIQNNHTCRSQQILHYFDEFTSKRCGICDVCIRNKKSNNLDFPKSILELLKVEKKMSQQEIMVKLETSEEAILIHLRKLLSEGVVGITKDNKIFLK